MVEDAERAVDIDLQGCGNALGLVLLLGTESAVQVSQCRHVLRHRIQKVLLIDDRQAPVDHGFFLRFNAVAGAHDQLAQGEDEIGLEAEGIVIIGIVQIDVHGVDIVVAGR